MSELAETLRRVDSNAVAGGERAGLSEMLARDLWRRFREANRREEQAWAQVKSKDDWERFRDERIDALRRSLGKWPPPDAPPPEVEVTGRLSGEGFTIENLLFTARAGLVVTANLYLPDPPRDSMPAIVLCHSHHRPKGQGELQDMGMNWAQCGAAVLVMDQIGHGERRQQPFGGREDYHWRYLLGMQLDLVGESLAGWMAWELVRGLEVLLGRPGVDAGRVVLIGAVAGGGDVAAVAAALDERFTCSVPFNFGSAERVPPEHAETAGELNFAGSGSWESTRNLRASARDGFFPWVIVAAVAPRLLVSAHEFEWSRQSDPVWARLQQVYGCYAAADRLDSLHGWGEVTKRPPAASHCTNVGPPHREQLYPMLQRWLGLPPPQPEVQRRVEEEQLNCLVGEAAERRRPKMVHELAAELAAAEVAAARAALSGLDPPRRAAKLRADLDELLGGTEPHAEPVERRRAAERLGGATIERVVLEAEPGIAVPLLLLLPAGASGPPPVVVGFAQEGKGRFLAERCGEIAALLEAGAAVCLPDLRGTGETAPEAPHAWQLAWNSPGTWMSSSELMLGGTLLGGRVRDARAVLRYLRGRGELAGGRAALWGDSFSPVNPERFDDPPLKTEAPPHLAEPTGALVALLGGLFEESVRAVSARRGIVGFCSLAAAPACHVPHDVLVPGVVRAGDVADVAAALAPRGLRLVEPVDGRNRAVAGEALRGWLQPVVEAYAGQADRLAILPEADGRAAAWLTEQLRCA